jgi:hypothetical protein
MCDSHATSVVLPAVPGQELEKATADVARDAGKSLIRGIEAIAGAKCAVWIAENMAKAEVARRAIETQGAIEERRVLARERRRLELEEIKHQETKAVAERRLERLLVEMEREQTNFEAIAVRSLKLIEHDPGGDKPREVDADWMFKFARHAQEISDDEMRELWARILASTVIEGRPRISPAALQVMSLLDKPTAIDFQKFCRVWRSFGIYPAHARVYQCETQAINLQALEELGLIQEGASRSEYLFPEFKMTLANVPPFSALGCRVFTQRGSQIANAVFHDRTDRLADDLEIKYFQEIFSIELEEFTIEIIPKIDFSKIDGQEVPYAIEIRKRSAQLPIAEDRQWHENLPNQLRRLVEWADENYQVSRRPVANARL